MSASIAAMLAVGAFLAAPGAGAQSYPTKPIHLVVPYPAAGGTDFLRGSLDRKCHPQRQHPAGLMQGLDGVRRCAATSLFSPMSLPRCCVS
jgi:hypothetical protein